MYVDIVSFKLFKNNFNFKMMPANTGNCSIYIYLFIHRSNSMEGYIGEIRMFVGNFAPMNWLYCWGQTLAISQYDALYAIIGTQYGGNGRDSFQLPDLRGRIPIGAGDGPGLTSRIPGQMSGAESVALTIANMPQHTHNVLCDTTTPADQLKTAPQNNIPAVLSAGAGYGADTTNNPTMKNGMINSAGNGQNHENMPPWGCLNYIICCNGIYPPHS